jgi:RNA polymerase sigma-70 factor (ECF subfamily)
MESDGELLERWRLGDKSAGTSLFARHFASIRRFFASKIGPSDVEDLVQRTFMGCVEATERFREDASFRTFLFAIAKRQLYKYLRDRARKDAREEPDFTMSSVQALGHSPSSVLAAEQERSVLLTALQRVSVEDQTLLELHYWEQLAAPEIAEVLGISSGAVRTRLHRARRELEEVVTMLLLPSGRAARSIDIDAVAIAVGSDV